MPMMPPAPRGGWGAVPPGMPTGMRLPQMPTPIRLGQALGPLPGNPQFDPVLAAHIRANMPQGGNLMGWRPQAPAGGLPSPLPWRGGLPPPPGVGMAPPPVGALHPGMMPLGMMPLGMMPPPGMPAGMSPGMSPGMPPVPGGGGAWPAPPRLPQVPAPGALPPLPGGAAPRLPGQGPSYYGG